MAVGDAVWYSGHGRYGTGPDFDRNFIEFRLYDKDGKLLQTLDDYVALEAVLRQGGKDPWKVFQERIADKTLQVDLSNAGNVRLVGNARDNEFGAHLINWALEQSKTKVVTGPEGQLGEEAKKGPQKYRVMAFYGCETNSYDAALRKTEGFGTKQADLLAHQPRHARRGRRRRLHGVPRRLRQPALGREDARRPEHRDAEERARVLRQPVGVHRPQGQPRREVTARTRGFAREGFRY